jgi:hypothetical protein
VDLSAKVSTCKVSIELRISYLKVAGLEDTLSVARLLLSRSATESQ